MNIPASFTDLLRMALGLSADYPLTQDMPLVDLGLDSLAAVNFIVDLEVSYGIEIDDTQLRAGTFATLQTLWEALEPTLPYGPR